MMIWLNHHYLFERLCKVDMKLNWINLGIIGTASLIPFPTGVLAGALRDGAIIDKKAAILLYALIASLMSAAWLPAFIHLRVTPASKARPAGDVLHSAATQTGGRNPLLRGGAALGWLVHPLIAVGVFCGGGWLLCLDQSRHRIRMVNRPAAGSFDLKAKTGVCDRVSGGNLSGIVETRN